MIPERLSVATLSASDPEGNVWEVAWAPGAVFGPLGELMGFGE